MLPISVHTDWFWLAVNILVAWRVSRMICYDSGPFALIVALRRLLYRLGLGTLIECYHCLALWVALIQVLLLYQLAIESLVIWIAVAAGASIVESWLYPAVARRDEENGEA